MPRTSRARAMVACAREVYVRGLSTRKIERAADALEFAILSPSRASRMTAELDEEVSAMRAARFDGMRFPYLWLDATYVKCRDEGRVQSKAVAEVFLGAAWQRCVVHLERDAAGWLGRREDRACALAALKAVFAEREPALVRAAYRRACEEVSGLSARAGELLEDAEADALAYLDSPPSTT